MDRRFKRIARLLVICGAFALPQTALSADPENCLLCHRYPGFGRVEADGESLRLYHVNPDYHDRQLGPHARLKCSDCHPRSEVGVIPHQPVSKVDCTSACHISSPNRVEQYFSHTRLEETLASSVHTTEILAECNTLLGAPLAAGQSLCLLCHAEPTFERPGLQLSDFSTDRCDVCHTQELPQDTQFAQRHVLARSRPQRSHRQLARSCALCHSNTLIRQRFRLPDSVASYLDSFHGKAMQLGADFTAGCLDCHVGELHNVHAMLAVDDPNSSVNKNRLPDTCRSSACHPNAGVQVTAAAVHLELSPSRYPQLQTSDISLQSQTAGGSPTGGGGYSSSSRTPEYLIALMFVVLIACTFGPSAVLQILELISLLVGRYSKRHHEKVAQARMLMATPTGRAALVRFTVHQRVQHWVLFACFTLLVITGFPIKFADRGWAEWAVGALGGLTTARGIHRYSGLVLIVGAFYHAAYVLWVFGRRLRQDGNGVVKTLLGLPMVVNRRDISELLHLLGYLFFIRRDRPLTGRFGLKEKFEYFGVFWGCALLGVTGVVMWGNAWTSHYVSGRVLTIASLIHTMEALLAILHVGLFHMIGVMLSPHVFPLSKAMFTGDTPIEELADAHGGMIAATAEKLGLGGGDNV